MSVIKIDSERHKLVKMFCSYGSLTMEQFVADLIDNDQDLIKFKEELKSYKFKNLTKD